MKRNKIVALTISALALVLSSNAFASNDSKTITGSGGCSGDERTVTVKEGDKEVVYHLVANEITRKYGDKLCGGSKVKVTGAVTMMGDKMELTPRTIEVVKD